MLDGKMNKEFRLKNIDETRDYFAEKINQNQLKRRSNKKVCRNLN